MPGGLRSPSPQATAGRLSALRAAMREATLDAVVVNRTAAKRHLAGFVLQAGEEATAPGGVSWAVGPGGCVAPCKTCGVVGRPPVGGRWGPVAGSPPACPPPPPRSPAGVGGGSRWRAAAGPRRPPGGGPGAGTAVTDPPLAARRSLEDDAETDRILEAEHARTA